MAEEMKQEQSKFVLGLIGSLGSGKSSTGNTICGQKIFKTGIGTRPITTQVSSHNLTLNEKNVLVCDTPGMEEAVDFDKIHNKISEIPDVVIVYAIIIRIGRFTEEEKDLLETLFRTRKALLQNTIIIFTNRNELFQNEDPAEVTIDSWLDKVPDLQNLMRRHDIKYLVFENGKTCSVEEKQQQTNDLFLLLGNFPNASQSSVSVNEFSDRKTIVVDREKMGIEFGRNGISFFDKEYSIQKQDGL